MEVPDYRTLVVDRLDCRTEYCVRLSCWDLAETGHHSQLVLVTTGECRVSCHHTEAPSQITAPPGQRRCPPPPRTSPSGSSGPATSSPLSRHTRCLVRESRRPTDWILPLQGSARVCWWGVCWWGHWSWSTGSTSGTRGSSPGWREGRERSSPC